MAGEGLWSVAYIKKERKKDALLESVSHRLCTNLSRCKQAHECTYRSTDVYTVLYTVRLRSMRYAAVPSKQSPSMLLNYVRV